MDTSTIVKISVAVGAALVFFACKYYWNLPATNPIEQAAEQLVEQETGIDLDPVTTTTTTGKKQ